MTVTSYRDEALPDGPDQCPGSGVLVTYDDDACPGCHVRPGTYTDGPNRRLEAHNRPDVGTALYAIYPDDSEDWVESWVTVTGVYADGGMDVVKGHWTGAQIPEAVEADAWTITAQQIESAAPRLMVKGGER